MKDGLKPEDLKPCAFCGKGLMHDNQMVCYEVTVRQHVFDVDSIRQLHGLEVMMGKAAPLASVFSPVSHVTKAMPSVTKLACLECAMVRQTCIGEIIETE